MRNQKMLSIFKKLKDKFFPPPRFKKFSSAEVSIYNGEIRVMVEASTNVCHVVGVKVYYLPTDAPNREIGGYAIRSLEEYMTDLKYPKDPKEQKKLDKHIKYNMKITSWRKYSKEAQKVSLRWNGENLKLFPIVKKGGLYVGGGDEKTDRTVDPDDHEAIGRTVRELWPFSK